LGRVTSLAVTDKYVLVGDVRGRCIRRYRLDGTYELDIGADNRMRGFAIRSGHLDFVLDGRGVIHASNQALHRIEQFSLEGKRLGRFGRFDGRDPVGFTGCCNPTNLGLTPAGDIVTVEKAPPRVKVYDVEGHLRAVMGEGDFELACKNSDVAVDPRGRIYVADTVVHQIVVYEPVAGAASRPAATTQEAAR
jgi:hypothetical protein